MPHPAYRSASLTCTPEKHQDDVQRTPWKGTKTFGTPCGRGASVGYATRSPHALEGVLREGEE